MEKVLQLQAEAESREQRLNEVIDHSSELEILLTTRECELENIKQRAGAEKSESLRLITEAVINCFCTLRISND